MVGEEGDTTAGFYGKHTVLTYKSLVWTTGTLGEKTSLIYNNHV